MTASKLLYLLASETFNANCAFGVYGIKHTDHLALYPGYTYSLYCLDSYP